MTSSIVNIEMGVTGDGSKYVVDVWKEKCELNFGTYQVNRMGQNENPISTCCVGVI